MDLCLKPSILLFFVFMAVIIDLGECQNECNESRCGAHGPPVRFPFRLNSQPDRCGYPGFHLSCTETNDTVLELPISVKLFVKEINYTSQVIQLYDPHHCFLRQFRALDLSSTHFRFNEEFYNYDFHNFALFNCSPRKVDYLNIITCLSGPGYQVYIAYSGGSVDTKLLSCTKMCSLRSIPDDIVSSNEKILEMKWSRPDCGLCEVKGKKCRWKNNSTQSETECFPRDAGIVFYPVLHGS